MNERVDFHEPFHNDEPDTCIQDDKHKKKSGASKIFSLLKRRSVSKKGTSPNKNGSFSKSDSDDFKMRDETLYMSSNLKDSSSKDNEHLSKKDKKKIKKENKRSEKAIKEKIKNEKRSPKHSITESNVTGLDLLLEQSKADKIHFEDETAQERIIYTDDEPVNVLTPRTIVHPNKVSLNDFRIIKLIGKGGFGEVYLVEHESKKKKLALKVLDKKHIASTKKAQCILNERDVLVKGKVNPFLMHLSYSWQDDRYLYLAMKYCPGGDLRSLLTAIGPFEEDEARLYMAEMILAVDSLHKMGYIHRDLKPDNFLIDKHGHIVLADFGLSTEKGEDIEMPPLQMAFLNKKVDRHLRAQSILLGEQELEELNRINFNSRFTRTRSNAVLSEKQLPKYKEVNPRGSLVDVLKTQSRKNKAFSIVGSPEYMSPEILSEGGYNKEVDWWSLGCIFFELLLGETPFTGETPEEIFQNISNWKIFLPQVLGQYSEYFSKTCFDLISNLICGQEMRLGKNGIKEIKEHPFFENLNWDDIREEVPPFIPKLEDDEDTSYFDDNLENIKQELLPTDRILYSPSKLKLHYKDFTHDEVEPIAML